MQLFALIPRKSSLLAVLVMWGLCASLAQAQLTPLGLWKTFHEESQVARSLVRVTETNGVVSGRVEKLLDPALKPDEVCSRCKDEWHDKPIVGMTVVRGVRQSRSDPALWDGGEIIDPHNGKIFSVRLTPVDGGRRLEVRGYLGAPMLGRTLNWVRVE
jgi:uncharacterized protein (DUF2147 family)